MALPFKVGPESSQRPAEADPFLEFESERPGRRVSSHPFFKDQLLRPEPAQAPQPDLSRVQPPSLPPLPAIVQTSKPVISPVVGFAVGVAGIAAAAVAYYQLAQFVAKKNAEQPTVAATAPVEAGGRAADSTAPIAGRAAAAQKPPSTTRNATAAASSRPRTQVKATDRAAGRATGSTAPATAIVETGVVTFSTPVALQVMAGGRPIGSTADGRVSLPPGTHTLTFANSLLEFRQTLPVTVQAGRAIQLTVPLPSGSLSLNALPWAEVWVDGSSVGTTPLANLSVPIGSHEVVWRHPTLGERRQTVVVKAQTPARIGVDFNR